MKSRISVSAWEPKIQAYDPEAARTARKVFGKRIRYAGSNYAALQGADALILVTEWNIFRHPDFQRIKKLLKQPVIFDGRNQYDPRELREMGFTYICIGRPSASSASPSASSAGSKSSQTSPTHD